jgi:hypothetical protein
MSKRKQSRAERYRAAIQRQLAPFRRGGGILGDWQGSSSDGPSSDGPAVSPVEPWRIVAELIPSWRPPESPKRRPRGRPRLPLAEIVRDEHGRYGLRRRANLLEPEDSINFKSAKRHAARVRKRERERE